MSPALWWPNWVSAVTAVQLLLSKHLGLTACVVPDSVVGELHSICVLCLLKVLVGVSADVAATSDVSADQTNPEVLGREKTGQTGQERKDRKQISASSRSDTS